MSLKMNQWVRAAEIRPNTKTHMVLAVQREDPETGLEYGLFANSLKNLGKAYKLYTDEPLTSNKVYRVAVMPANCVTTAEPFNGWMDDDPQGPNALKNAERFDPDLAKPSPADDDDLL